jgi:FtsP/CotA-like multicopper oxidase with cupredoxin domain
MRKGTLRLDRRAVLAGGVAASLWLWRGATSAQALPTPARRLTAGPAAQSLAPAPAGPTRILAYDGGAPGPLLRLRRGEEFALILANQLAEPTSLSFPGLRLANAVAGIAGLTGAALPPGGEAEIRFTPPDSGFGLYLPDVGAATARQFASGLYGPIVVEEAAPPDIDLETIVVLAQWRVDASGALSDDFAADFAPSEVTVELLTAGPAAAPLRVAAAPGARVRLRLANATPARAMTIAVAGAAPQIVAVDGQPSALFAPLRGQFPMAPGACFELMFDMPEATFAFALRDDEGRVADLPLVAFESQGAPRPARPAIVALPPNPLLPDKIDLARAHRFQVMLSGGGAAPFAINGDTLSDWSAKPLFAAPLHAPVTLTLVNATEATQTMRLGGHVGRQLHALDDGWEPYWRDIFLLAPGRTIHVAFVADNPGKWSLASVTPARRSAGLCGWFQVG